MYYPLPLLLCDMNLMEVWEMIIDGKKFVFAKHVAERMMERRITRNDVYDTLVNGEWMNCPWGKCNILVRKGIIEVKMYQRSDGSYYVMTVNYTAEFNNHVKEFMDKWKVWKNKQDVINCIRYWYY